MTLDEFIAAYAEDNNMFWKLSSGDVQNLLEEAIERGAEKDAEIEGLKVDAEIGSFLQSEIKAMCESAGIDMSGTPPMMYPEAIMRIVRDSSADNADAILVSYQQGRADGKKDADSKL